MQAIKFPVFLLFCLAITGCDQSVKLKEGGLAKVSPDELEQFVAKVKDNLIFVEGGEFLMGDYGVQHGPERLPYDSDKDSKPLHKVELSDYFIDKFKITNEEFQFYLKYNGMSLRIMGEGLQRIWKDISSAPNTPAHLDWHEADQYCSWLAKVSGLPFSLATEAQWEYAARSRGQFLMVATDDGSYKATNDPVTRDWKDGPKGINISSSWDRKTFAKEMGWTTGTLTPLPVDRFPPNPLGLYAMSDNGLEWVKDWYDPNYYQYSPLRDPQGPNKPVGKDYLGRDTKVLRGQGFADPTWGGGVNVYRTPAEPNGYLDDSDMVFLRDKTARCVVNSPRSVI
ncbi:Serine/threonine-protein kinase pkn1 [compost metagenome]